MAKFQVGDRVRLKKGWTLMEVAEVSGRNVVAIYSHGIPCNKTAEEYYSGYFHSGVKSRDCSEFVHWVEKDTMSEIQKDSEKRFPLGKKFIDRKNYNNFGEVVKITKKGNVVLNVRGEKMKFDPRDLRKEWDYFMKVYLLQDYLRSENPKERYIKTSEHNLSNELICGSIATVCGNLYVFDSFCETPRDYALNYDMIKVHDSKIHLKGRNFA